MLVPEVRGQIRPEDVAISVVDLLRRPEKRKAIGAKLRAVMGNSGAAYRLADEVLAAVGTTKQ
jgi:lipid-A-disaccharide synthase